MTEPADLYGVVANVVSDRVFRTGAKVWILHSDGDASCPIAHGIGKGGGYVKKRTHFKRLTNYRAAWIPEHLRDRVWSGWQWPEKGKAADRAAWMQTMWERVRFYNRDGSVLKRDGISQQEAFNTIAAISPFPGSATSSRP
jgi:hypothetical protein